MKNSWILYSTRSQSALFDAPFWLRLRQSQKKCSTARQATSALFFRLPRLAQKCAVKNAQIVTALSIYSVFISSFAYSADEYARWLRQAEANYNRQKTKIEREHNSKAYALQAQKNQAQKSFDSRIWAKEREKTQAESQHRSKAWELDRHIKQAKSNYEQKVRTLGSQGNQDVNAFQQAINDWHQEEKNLRSQVPINNQTRDQKIAKADREIAGIKNEKQQEFTRLDAEISRIEPARDASKSGWADRHERKKDQMRRFMDTATEEIAKRVQDLSSNVVRIGMDDVPKGAIAYYSDPADGSRVNFIMGGEFSLAAPPIQASKPDDTPPKTTPSELPPPKWVIDFRKHNGKFIGWVPIQISSVYGMDKSNPDYKKLSPPMELLLAGVASNELTSNEKGDIIYDGKVRLWLEWWSSVDGRVYDKKFTDIEERELDKKLLRQAREVLLIHRKESLPNIDSSNTDKSKTTDIEQAEKQARSDTPVGIASSAKELGDEKTPPPVKLPTVPEKVAEVPVESAEHDTAKEEIKYPLEILLPEGCEQFSAKLEKGDVVHLLHKKENETTPQLLGLVSGMNTEYPERVVACIEDTIGFIAKRLIPEEVMSVELSKASNVELSDVHLGNVEGGLFIITGEKLVLIQKALILSSYERIWVDELASGKIGFRLVTKGVRKYTTEVSKNGSQVVAGPFKQAPENMRKAVEPQSVEDAINIEKN